MAHWVSSAATCPYYRLETPTMVQCEGLDEDGNLKLSYRDSKETQRHIDRLCHGAWQQCPIAQMLEHKYEGG